MLHYSRPIKTR